MQQWVDTYLHNIISIAGYMSISWYLRNIQYIHPSISIYWILRQSQIFSQTCFQMFFCRHLVIYLFIYLLDIYLATCLSMIYLENGVYTYIYIHIQSIVHMCVVPYFRRYLSTNLFIIYHDLSIYLLIHLFTMPHIPEHMIDWQSLERT